MVDILNNLNKGEALYVTSKKTQYLYIGRSSDFGVKYSIKNNQKTLPLNTINAAIVSINNGEEINRTWYDEFNPHESKTRGCNLQVLKKLIQRL